MFEAGIYRGRPNLPALPWLSPRQDTHDQRAGAVIEGGEEANEGGGGVPERDQRGHDVGDGDNIEEQRGGVGAKALPLGGSPRSGGKPEPTIFETLTTLRLPGNADNVVWVDNRFGVGA